MTKIFNYLWRFWMVCLGIMLTLLCFLPVYLLSIKRNHFRYAYFFIRLWCFGMFYGMGFRYSLIEKTHKKIDKNKQYIFISNHTSIMDIMLTCILQPHHPLCFVGKKELEKIPIFGTIYRRICVLVDRSSAQSRADVYKKCAVRMAEGDSIVIFPEGGVPDDTSVVLDKFKDGAFSLATNHQFPIAVYTYVGLKEMFPFDNSKGFPGRVKVYFNEILEPEKSLSELKEDAFQKIYNQLISEKVL